MRTEAIKFADIEKLLLTLGFVNLQNSQHQLFEHPQEGALVTFPNYSPDDTVRPAHLVATRGTLEAYGLMSREAFDGMTEKVFS
jgi:predicted RNA binding protein YcfA (HicA-like mRNA interferase family)